MSNNSNHKIGERIFQIVIFLIAVIILVFAFLPIFIMITLSLKDQVQIYGNFWSLPNPPDWENYNLAFTKLLPNMINSLIVVSVGVVGAVLLAANSRLCVCKVGFPREEFPVYGDYGLDDDSRLFDPDASVYLNPRYGLEKLLVCLMASLDCRRSGVWHYSLPHLYVGHPHGNF